MTDELVHYGVKGMHWGVRKTSSKPAYKQSSDHKTTRALMQKPVSSLSNQELQVINNRLGLEQRMSQLNPSKLQRGLKAVKTVLGLHGTIKAASKLIPKKPQVSTA